MHAHARESVFFRVAWRNVRGLCMWRAWSARVRAWSVHVARVCGLFVLGLLVVRCACVRSCVRACVLAAVCACFCVRMLLCVRAARVEQ